MPELRLLHVLEPEAGGRRLSRATPRVAFGSCGGGSPRRPASGPSPAASSNLGESVGGTPPDARCKGADHPARPRARRRLLALRRPRGAHRRGDRARRAANDARGRRGQDLCARGSMGRARVMSTRCATRSRSTEPARQALRRGQWGEQDSNLRRHSQRVYSPSPLATRAHSRPRGAGYRSPTASRRAGSATRAAAPGASACCSRSGGCARGSRRKRDRPPRASAPGGP